MFAARYFADRYFPPRYFPHGSAAAASTPETPLADVCRFLDPTAAVAGTFSDAAVAGTPVFSSPAAGAGVFADPTVDPCQ